VQAFRQRLVDHLLVRLDPDSTADIDEPEFTAMDRHRVIIKKDQLNLHQFVRINYTTYDLRREQDTLKAGGTNCDIVMLANEDDDTDGDNAHFPLWAARVIHVIHVDACLKTSQNERWAKPKRIDILYVRYFAIDDGTTPDRLPRFAFAETEGEDGNLAPITGFVDPGRVLRGVHMIPSFRDGFRELPFPSALLNRPEHLYRMYCMNV